MLAAGDKDGKVRLFDGQTCAAKQVLEHGEAQVLSVAFTDDKHLVSSGSIVPDPDAANVPGAGAVKFWDLQAGKLLRTLEKEGSAMYQVAASPTGGLLATGGFRKERTGGSRRSYCGTQRPVNGSRLCLSNDSPCSGSPSLPTARRQLWLGGQGAI